MANYADSDTRVSLVLYRFKKDGKYFYELPRFWRVKPNAELTGGGGESFMEMAPWADRTGADGTFRTLPIIDDIEILDGPPYGDAFHME